MTLVARAYDKAMNALPPRVAARIDEVRRPRDPAWGGPLNGQVGRRAIVRELARTIDFDHVLETGTFRGTSTEFFSHVFGTPLTTVEANLRYYVYSERRMTIDRNVTVVHNDSRNFLRDMGDRIPEHTVFVYLDAHWEQDLPLRDELEIIAAAWKNAVVLIDDFAVPYDPGYAFDDYGSGKALVEGYLPAESLTGWSLRYPTMPSSEETGAKRGCCALFSPALADLETSTLREVRRL